MWQNRVAYLTGAAFLTIFVLVVAFIKSTLTGPGGMILFTLAMMPWAAIGWQLFPSVENRVAVTAFIYGCLTLNCIVMFLLGYWTGTRVNRQRAAVGYFIGPPGLDLAERRRDLRQALLVLGILLLVVVMLFGALLCGSKP